MSFGRDDETLDEEDESSIDNLIKSMRNRPEGASKGTEMANAVGPDDEAIIQKKSNSVVADDQTGQSEATSSRIRGRGKFTVANHYTNKIHS